MDIKDTALRYLASRPRTCGEMKNFLRQKGFEEPEIDDIIDHLRNLRYLDDLEYCRQYFDYAFGKGKGLFRVKRELEEKGVENSTIQIAFEDYEAEETEFERAKKQAEKIAAGKPADQKLAGRIGRRLSSLGYSSELIYRIVGMYMGERNE